jgi:Sulfatase
LSPKRLPRLSAPATGIVAGALVGLIDVLVILFHPPSRGAWDVPAWTWLTVPWLWITICCFAGVVLSWRPLRRLAGVAFVFLGVGALLLSRVATPLKTATGMSSKTILLLWLAVLLVLAIPAFLYRFGDARRIGLWVAATVVSLAFLLLSALSVKPADLLARDRTPVSASGQRNVVLVFLDTVRHDDAMTSMPRLARFRDGALSFDRAFAPAAWTVPSHAAVLTGVEPYRASAAGAQMLARRFDARGYTTGAVFANPLLSTTGGFDRHYDEFFVGRGVGVCRSAIGDLLSRLWVNDAPRSPLCGWPLAPEVTRHALRFMQQAKRPYFLTLNYLDAHDPYYVRPECRGPGDRPLRRAEREAVLAQRPDKPVDPALSARAHEQYRRALQCLDRSLGTLLDAIDRDPDAATTTVVFVGDHGEHFGEHGLGSHGNSVFAPVLHVPLIAKVPDAKPARIDAAVTITDLHHALVQSLDAPAKPFRLLDPAWRRRVIADYEEITHNEEAFTFVDDRFQYIRWDTGREALFDRDGREVPLSSEPVWLAAARDIVSRAKAAKRGGTAFDALGYLQ